MGFSNDAIRALTEQRVGDPFNGSVRRRACVREGGWTFGGAWPWLTE